MELVYVEKSGGDVYSRGLQTYLDKMHRFFTKNQAVLYLNKNFNVIIHKRIWLHIEIYRNDQDLQLKFQTKQDMMVEII